MMLGQRAGGLDALAERRKPARVLERIAWCHQPPDAVKLQALEREQGGAEMGLMRRIERAAE